MKINMQWEDDKVTCVTIDSNKLTLRRPLTMEEAQQMIQLVKDISKFVYLWAHELTTKETAKEAKQQEIQLLQKISRKGEAEGGISPTEVREMIKIVYPDITVSANKKKASETMKHLCKTSKYWKAIGGTKNRRYIFDRAQWKHDLKTSVTPAK